MGTVDRVIHKRGQVSEDNKIKIQKIVEELNYRPNLLARVLASKRNYLIASLIPESSNKNSYWDASTLGIQKGWKEILDYNVKLVNLLYNQFKVESFVQKTLELMEYKPDAVLIAPVFTQETIEFTKQLDEKNIPYVFIDSTIEGVNNLAYFGQHSYQSGYLAARLLEMGLSENAGVAVIKPSKTSISNQTLSREKGFNAFFKQNNLKRRYNFLYVDYSLDDEVEREKQLEQFFTDNSNISAVVVFNSRVYEVAHVIEKLKLIQIRLIGYDLLKANADFLRKGIVTFLLAQRPEEQGYQGIMTLFNYLAFKKEIQKVQYVPIDILTKENLDYYINFNNK